jgi:GDP-L-fucose synthase
VVAEVLGFDGDFTHDLSKPEGMAQKVVDTSRQTDLGWQPKIALDDGIARTYEYYLSAREGL